MLRINVVKIVLIAWTIVFAAYSNLFRHSSSQMSEECTCTSCETVSVVNLWTSISCLLIPFLDEPDSAIGVDA